MASIPSNVSGFSVIMRFLRCATVFVRSISTKKARAVDSPSIRQNTVRSMSGMALRSINERKGREIKVRVVKKERDVEKVQNEEKAKDERKKREKDVRRCGVKRKGEKG